MTQSPHKSTAGRPTSSASAPHAPHRLKLRSSSGLLSSGRRRRKDPDASGPGWLQHGAAAEVIVWSIAGVAILVASLLSSCASGPDLRRVVTITDQDVAEFSYEQALDGGLRSFRQALINDGQIDPTAFYSAPDTDPFTKVVSTERLQVLVDALAARGFFDYARGSMAPGSVSRMQFRLDGQQYVWSKQPGIEADELRAYNQALVDFQNVYNAVTSYHTGKGRNSVSDRHRENVERYLMERDLRPRDDDGELLEPESRNR